MVAVRALVLLALVLAGCGGDDDGNGAADASPSASQEQTTAGEADASGEGSAAGEEAGGSTGGDGSTGDDADLTRAQYITRADQICTQVRRELADGGERVAALARRAAQGKVDPETYYRESARLTEASADAAGDAVDELEALPRPDSRRDALERYLVATRQQVEYLADQADALADRDQAQIAKLNAVTARTGERVRAAARDYGFKVCGGG